MGFVASKLTIGPKSASKIFEAHHGAPAKGGKLASITSQNAISRVMMHGEKWKPSDEPGRQRSMPLLGAHRSGPFFFVELEHRLTDSLGQHPSLSCGLTLLFSFLCSSFKGPRGPEKKTKKAKKRRTKASISNLVCTWIVGADPPYGWSTNCTTLPLGEIVKQLDKMMTGFRHMRRDYHFKGDAPKAGGLKHHTIMNE